MRGHRVYRARDPRADVLKTVAARSEMMRRLSTVGDRVLSGQPSVKALYDLMVARGEAHP